MKDFDTILQEHSLQQISNEVLEYLASQVEENNETHSCVLLSGLPCGS
jgi:hypothetical protein